MTELWGILLAAGSSTRLGRPKQLVDVHGESALRHAARTLGAITGRNTLVVLGFSHERLRRQLTDLHCVVVFNPEWKSGMASSLKIAIHALPASAEGALVMTCDQLEMEAMDLERLKESWLEQPQAVAAASYADTIGVPVIFPSHWFERFERLTGDHGAKQLLRDAAADEVRPVDVPNAAFDLDTEEDLARFNQRSS